MVKKTAKNQLNRSLLRRIIFRAKDRPVSRQELIQDSGLNPRTVDTYTREMEEKGLIVREAPPEDMKPHGIVFRSNSESIIFLGIHMSHMMFTCVITDINNQPLTLESMPVSESDNDFQPFFDKIISTVESFPTMKLLGVGMVFHPYMQLQERRNSFYELSNKLKRCFSVPLSLLDTPNAGLYELYHSRNLLHTAFNKEKDCNIGMLHLSDRIYPALIINGEPMLFPLRTSPRMKKLLDGVLTHDMILGKLNLAILPPYNSIQLYREAVYQGNPAACKISLEEAARLAVAIRLLKEEFELDVFFLSNVIPHTFDAVKEILAGKKDMENFIIEPIREPNCMKNVAISSMLAINNSIAPPTFEFVTF